MILLWIMIFIIDVDRINLYIILYLIRNETKLIESFFKIIFKTRIMIYIVRKETKQNKKVGPTEI